MERMESRQVSTCRESDGCREPGRPESIDRLRSLIDRTRPVATADKKILPVLPVLEEFLVDRGLRRGTTVEVSGHIGATSLALAVAAQATRSGSWLACIGIPQMGWGAAAEVGVDLNNVAVVRSSEPMFVKATAALIDAFDVILCGLSSNSVTSSDARKLATRTRERSSVLILVNSNCGGVGTPRRGWPEVTDVKLSVVGSEWVGSEWVGSEWEGASAGNGRLRRRRLTAEVSGRRGFNRVRRVDLLLPGPDGSISLVEQPEQSEQAEQTDVVVPLRRAG